MVLVLKTAGALFGVIAGAALCYVSLLPYLADPGAHWMPGASAAGDPGAQLAGDVIQSLPMTRGGRPSDGAGGARREPVAAATSRAPEAKPRVIFVMVETRFCDPEQKNPRWKRDYKAKRSMRFSAASLTRHYAEQHGYEFRVYCEGDPRGFATAWLKVRALEELFAEAAEMDRPSYVVVMDSDCYVRAMDVELPVWLEKHGVSLPRAPWSLMYTKEADVPPRFKATGERGFTVNTGVAYGYVEPADKARTAAALKALRHWQDAVCDECQEYQTEDKHPWEQGCLEVLLGRAPDVQSQINVSQLHMNVWNGPWGQYIRHAWGGPGKDLRKWVFNDMVLTYRVDVDQSVVAIKKSHLGAKLVFKDPGCLPKPTEMVRNTN